MKPSSNQGKNFKRFLCGISNVLGFGWIKNLWLFFKGIFEARHYRSSSKITDDLNREQQQAYLDAKKQAEAAVRQAEQKAEAIGVEIQGVKNANKLKLGRLKSIHQKLLANSALYRKWNSHPNVAFHNISLVCVLVFTFTFSAIFLYGPMYKRALADAQTCTWDGSASTSWDDPSNWANSGYCNGTSTIPGSGQNIAFGTVVNDLILTSNRTVTAVTSVAGMDKTFNTAGYSLNINGGLTWQTGTFNASTSLITVSGNLDFSGPSTFTYGSSNFILSGAGATTLSPKTANALSFYDLTIQKDANNTAVTVESNDFNVQNKLSINKGVLTGNSRIVTMSVDGSRYHIRDTVGGTATIKFSSSGYVDAAGGTANDTVDINGAGKTVYWNGSATTKFVTVTDGSLNIQSGKLSFPASAAGAEGKLACASGKVLTFAGTAVGRMVILRSQTPGSAWYFENSCGATANYVDVKDSNNTGSAITVAAGVDNTGNTGWTVTEISNLKKWQGDVSSDWSTATNWVGDSKPSSASDYAYFGIAYSPTSVNCNLSVDIGVGGIISSDFIGTLSTTVSAYNMAVTGLTWNSGTIDANGSTITSLGNSDLTGGTFTAGTSRFTFSGGAASFIANSSSSFYDLEFAKSGALSTYNTQPLSRNLIISSGTAAGAGYIDFNGTVDQTITSSGGTAPNIIFSKSSGNVNMSGAFSSMDFKSKSPFAGIFDTHNYNLTANGVFGWKSGTLTAGSSTITLNGAGVDDFSGGTFVKGTSTVAFTHSDLSNGGKQIWTPGSSIFNNITLNKTSDYSDWGQLDIIGSVDVDGWVNIIDGEMSTGTINLSSDLTITSIDGQGGYVVFNGAGNQTLTCESCEAPSLDVSSSGTVNLVGNMGLYGDLKVTAGTFNPGSYTITFNHPDSVQTWTPGPETYSNIALNKTSGYSNHMLVSIIGTAHINNLTIADGTFDGLMAISGNLTIAATANNDFTGTTSLTGAGIQTITTSAGLMPTLTINKSSGKVVFATDDGSGTINNNITMTAGTLEFAGSATGNNTFTITAGKSLTTSAGTITRFAGADTSHRPILTSSGNWNYANTGKTYANWATVDHSQATNMVYAMNSTDAGSNNNWDFTSTPKTWDAGAGTLVWNDANNWNPDGVPDGNDTVTVNSVVASIDVTTNANISFGTLTVGGNTTYTNKLTLVNDINSAGDLTVTSNGNFEQKNNWNTVLAFGGDVTVTGADANHKGTITHGDNSTAETYRLNIMVGNNTVVDSYGLINVDGLGYDVQNGSGYAANVGSSYGGKGGDYGSSDSPATYGSYSAPTNLGSGSTSYSGSGAIKLSTAGSFTANGTISANSYCGAGTGFGSSGGSIYITSSTFSGTTGAINANGGCTSNGPGGGGGRIALYYGSKTFSGTVLASGKAGSNSSGAGTIFEKSSAQTNGTLTADNNDVDGRLNTTQLAAGTNLALDSIVLNNRGVLEIQSGTTIATASISITGDGTGSIQNYGGTFTPPGSTFTIGSSYGYIHRSGTLTGVTDIVVASGGVLTFATTSQFVLSGGLTINSGGTLTHLAHSVRDGSSKNYELNLSIGGNLTVNGTISANGLGSVHDAGTGAGSGVTNGGGGGFGGVGGKGAGEGSGGGITYGAQKDVAYIGSGGGKATGGQAGGQIELTVSGKTDIGVTSGSALVSANGSVGTTVGGGGSGGSILISTVGNLTVGNYGSITANGGAGGSSGGGGGGGGRILLITKGDRSTSTVTASGAAGGGGGEAGASGTIVNQASPNVPTLSTPSDTAINQSQALAFTFTTTDGDSDWLRYRVQIADNAEFTQTLRTLTQNSGSQTVTDNNLTATFSGQSGAGDPAGTGYTSGATATLTIASSTPLIQGQIYYWRVAAYDPAGVDAYDGQEHWTNYPTAKSFTVSSIDKTVYTTGTSQTIRAATDTTCSSIITFEIRNSINEKVKLLSQTTFSLSDGSSGGVFYTNSSCTTVIGSNNLVLAVGADTGSFYYSNTHSRVAAYTLTTPENPSQGWTDATTTMQVNPGNFHHLTISGVPTEITTDDVFQGNVIVAAIDPVGNTKFDFTGKVWFTTDSANYTLPYTAFNQSYTFTGVGGDEGDHPFPGSGFQLKTTGSKKVYAHNATYDGVNDGYASTYQTATVYPGAANEFYMEDYPKAISPSFPRFVLSGNTWTDGSLNGAPHAYNVKVTVRDLYDNIKTDYYDGENKLWFGVYTAAGESADCTTQYDSSSKYYTFTQGNAGVKTFDSSYFSCNTSGNNLSFRAMNGTITSSDTIYIKPQGLSSFLLETTPTLSRGGTSWDKAVDTVWSETPTLTAFDANGQVKVNYKYDPEDPDYVAGVGLVYFYSDERPSHDAGTPYTNQEFADYKTSLADTAHCHQFLNPDNDGTETFAPSDFEFLKGGRRTIYASECINPTSAYAVARGLYDPKFEDQPQERPNPVSYGQLPVLNADPATIAVPAHVPGTDDTYDSHTGGKTNFISSPGDTKIKLSWLNPFDAPIITGTESRIYIYQCTVPSACTGDGDFSLLGVNFRPLVGTPGQWQDQEITGLTNNQEYKYRLKLGYRRSGTTYILSDFSQTVFETPKEIAPIIASQVQLDQADATHPGQVKIVYSLRFDSTMSFEYFNPSTLAWGAISKAASVTWESAEDQTAWDGSLPLSGNFDSPISHTVYIEMNDVDDLGHYDGQYLNNSFKVRVKVAVEDQGSSSSDTDAFRLDTKNPATTSSSLLINATAGTTANLTISATDDSLPMQMKICNNAADGAGCVFKAYAPTKLDWSIAGATSIFVTFRDLYYNDTVIHTDITAAPTVFKVKDASEISTNDFRLVIIWHAVENTAHYNVWRSTDGINFSMIKEVTDNGYLNISLDSANTYGYYVTAEDSLGNISLPTIVASAKPGSAPAVNQDPTIELYGWKQDQGVRARITWNTDQLSDSNIAYSTGVLHAGSDNTADGGSIVKINTLPDMTTSHEIWLYNLEPQTKYCFKAYSQNEIKIAGYSNVLTFTTPEKLALLVSGMKISDITMTSALVNWETSKAATTVLEYGPSTAYGKTLTDSNFNINHAFKLESLDSGVEYNVRAKVTDSDGNVTISDNYTFDVPAMPIVSGVSVGETTFDTATINWSTNVNTDSNVEYASQSPITKKQETNSSTSSGQASSNANTGSGMQGKADSTTVHSVTLIGLEAKTTYSFRALSRDKFGNSAESSGGSFTTASDTQAPKVSNVQAEVSSTGSGATVKYQAVISWETDEPATSQIEYSAGISGDYTESTKEDLSLNSTHVVIIPDLKPNSAYHFRIKSADKAGNTGVSDDTSLITPPQEKSLLSIILKSLEDTFSWVGRIREKWGK